SVRVRLGRRSRAAHPRAGGRRAPPRPPLRRRRRRARAPQLRLLSGAASRGGDPDRGTARQVTTAAEPGVWHPRYVWVTVGAVAMIFLAAMQALAVTTVMPVVSADLGGQNLYAVAFAGTLATSVIGMVGLGAWCDRRDPVMPLATAVALFVAGLVVAGIAPTMEVLVAGRLLQGLGTGGMTVSLYVVVARVYPGALHGRVFAAFSAAWVVPSLIGPFLAGAVADYLHWRW